MTPITFPDAQAAVLAILRGSGAYAEGVTFGRRALDPVDNARPLPYVAVRLDATRTSRKVAQEATIRVSVWAATEAAGLALAQTLHGVLLAFAGDASVRSFGALTGPVPTDDPDSGAPLSYFTVAARLRPIPL